MPALQKAYSRDEALAVAHDYLRKEYGPVAAMTQEQKDRYHERLGLIYCVVCAMFPIA